MTSTYLRCAMPRCDEPGTHRRQMLFYCPTHAIKVDVWRAKRKIPLQPAERGFGRT